MSIKRNIRVMLVIFVLLFALLATYLVYVIDAYGALWFASPYNTRVNARRSSTVTGDIFDRQGVLLATTDAEGGRVYPSSDETRLAMSHILGDSAGQTIGAQSFFAKYLLDFDSAALGSLKVDEKRRGLDVTLTADAGLSAYLRELLGENRGAVLMMNYETGELLASASSPDFDLQEMAKYQSGEYVPEDSAFVNRATMGRYTPGSVFKLITTVAALRYIPNATERKFLCDGKMAFSSKTGKLLSEDLDPYDGEGKLLEGMSALVDFEGEVHGELTLKEAFTHSCNNIFAKLALEIGADRLKKTAESLGLNGEFVFDETVAYAGSYDTPKTDYELAWSGVGQFHDIMTPMNLALITSAVANGGVAMKPKLMLKASDLSGKVRATLESEEYKAYLNSDEATFLKECMESVVESGTGKKAAIDGLTVCGKTGTAEVSSTGALKPHAWFTGFIDDASHPYTVTVVIENGGGGGKIAAPLAADALRKAVELIG